MLKFWTVDAHFAENIHELRNACIRKQAHAPRFLNVLVDGQAVEASSARVILGGWLEYCGEYGGVRIELSRIAWVEAYF